MKAGWVFVALLVVAIPGSAAAQFKLFDQAGAALGALGGGKSLGSPRAPSLDEIADGLKQALRLGTERVVARLGRTDGFNADPEIHIPLPPSLVRVRSALAAIGLSSLADDLEERLNRAAEAATPKAKALFWKAVDDLTLDDVKRLYDGPDDAATRYLRRTMVGPLAAAMRPVIDASLAKVGAVAAYDTAIASYRSLPFVPDVKADLTDHVVGKALDGLFLYLGREEAAIRHDPLKRTTTLLVRVFGAGA